MDDERGDVSPAIRASGHFRLPDRVGSVLILRETSAADNHGSGELRVVPGPDRLVEGHPFLRIFRNRGEQYFVIRYRWSRIGDLFDGQCPVSRRGFDRIAIRTVPGKRFSGRAFATIVISGRTSSERKRS